MGLNPNNLPASLTHLDLFTGIGGFHLAVERAIEMYIRENRKK